MVIYHFLTYIRKFLLENFIIIIVINDGLSFVSLKLCSTCRESRGSSFRQLSLVLCEGCDSDEEIVVEDLATSSLVSLLFFGCEVNLGGEKGTKNTVHQSYTNCILYKQRNSQEIFTLNKYVSPEKNANLDEYGFLHGSPYTNSHHCCMSTSYIFCYACPSKR